MISPDPAELTITLSYDRLARFLEEAEWIDGEEIIWKAKNGGDWVQTFCRESLTRHVWSRLAEIAERQELERQVSALFAKYGIDPPGN